MRRFRDENGAEWDVVVGRESWGTLYALFVPVIAGDIRQTVLHAVTSLAAETEIEEMAVADLSALLKSATIKE